MSKQSHQPFPFNGGLRCERCGRYVAGIGNGPACDPVPWGLEALALRHVVGPNGACVRCGDRNSLFADEEPGLEYVLRSANRLLESGGHEFQWSGNLVSVPHLAEVPNCDGSARGRVDAET